ncbi:MAG TPA: porin family protein [Acidiferrobacteraceae bacterium]|nr:porin family protein [Acidiferrobacteraceae bacterium]
MNHRHNIRPRTLALALAFGTLVPALAQAYSSGFYIGAGGGSAHDRQIQDNLVTTPGFATATNGRRNAWKAFGGVDLGKVFGVEAGFVSLGTPTATNGVENVSVTSRGPYLDAVLRFPITRQFGVFAKGGAADLRSEVNSSIAGYSATRRTRATYGAGLKYSFTRNVGIRGEWERFRIPNNRTNLVSASLTFAFR